MSKPIPTFLLSHSPFIEQIDEKFDIRETFKQDGYHWPPAIIQKAVQDTIAEGQDRVLFCTSDLLTELVGNNIRFAESVDLANDRQASLMLCYADTIASAFQVDEHLFWIEKFEGAHVFVIFAPMFKQISEADVSKYSSVDNLLNSISKRTLIYFHTGQAALNGAERAIMATKYLQHAYGQNNDQDNLDDMISGDLTIPTYVINLPERSERKDHIIKQFDDKPEFDLQWIDACRHKVGALGLWLSIRKIINIAVENDDDVIIICEDDHQFTEYYNKENFLNNVVGAYLDGADLLSGGTGKFGRAVPINANRYWVDHCLSAQFVVFYRKFFQRILDTPFDENIIADMVYSRLTHDKMLLFPFISTQKDFGYSDVTDLHNEDKTIVQRMFTYSLSRAAKIRNEFLDLRS